MKKYLIIFIVVMLLFMGVFGISYSNAKGKVISIYNNFHSIVATINPLFFDDIGFVVGDDVQGLGTYTFQGETIPVLNYVLKDIGIKSFIDKYNSDPFTSYDFTLKDFEISNKMHLVHTAKGDYYCYKIIIDTNDKAVNCDGTYYYNAYDGYFPSVIWKNKTYKYLREGVVFDSYIDFFNQTGGTSLEMHVDKIEETDWTVNEFVNTEKFG